MLDDARGLRRVSSDENNPDLTPGLPAGLRQCPGLVTCKYVSMNK